ncbi:MAG TPA: GntR family transcriptional regulator [Streptosporangiaceae bacterium]|nr:GntR family transcriptional regulator [Streptosporangiaceae bacterium]
MPDQVRSTAYRTLASALRDAIRSGEYADGQLLPTEEQLSVRHSVSRQTVRRAMQDLVAEGIIYRVPGRGTYPVAAADRYLRHFGSVEDLMALSLDTECQVITPLRRTVDVTSASRLRLPSDDVCALTLIRLHGTVPFCHTSVFLPPRIGALVGDVAELAVPGARSRITVIGLIDTRMARRIKGAEQSITAAAAPPFAAECLECAAGEPVLRVDRLYTDDKESPVELAVSYFDPAHYSYRVKLRRSPS